MDISGKDKEFLLKIKKDTRSKYVVESINTLLMLSNGYSSEEIASVLNIKEHYVEIYKRRYTKHGLNIFSQKNYIENISFSFIDKGHGWVDFNIEFRQVSIKINISSIFDPFDDILNWLFEIKNGNKSSLIEIDEEGKIKQLSMTLLPEYKTELFEFRITGVRHEVDDFDIRKIVDKNTFVKELVIALKTFSQNSKDISWRTDKDLAKVIIEYISINELDKNLI